MGISPISKEALKSKRQLLKDVLAQEDAAIEKIQMDIDALKATKALHVAKKTAIQADIDNLTADIGG